MPPASSPQSLEPHISPPHRPFRAVAFAVGALVVVAVAAFLFISISSAPDAYDGGVLVAPADGLVAVSYEDSGGVFQIFAVSLDGSTRTQLTHNAFDSTYPRYSEDGKRIVYVGGAEGGVQLRIWVMNADGSGNRALTSVSEQPLTITPRFSPDGTMIAYAAGKVPKAPSEPLNLHLWVMRADGTGKKQLTSGDFANLGPTYSPDGKKIAFTSNRGGGRWQIWVMNADGGNPVRLTRSTTDAATGFPIEQKVPAWSPDGKYIAYWNGIEMDHLSESHRKGGTPTDIDWKILHSWHIWRMDADGSNQRELTQGDDPTWSPDSTGVLHPTMPTYGSNPQPDGPGEPMGIGMTNVDGSNRQVLFTTPQTGPRGYSWRPTE